MILGYNSDVVAHARGHGLELLGSHQVLAVGVGALCPVVGHDYRAGDVVPPLGIVVVAVQDHGVGIIQVRRNPIRVDEIFRGAKVSAEVMGWTFDDAIWWGWGCFVG